MSWRSSFIALDYLAQTETTKSKLVVGKMLNIS
uniref:Uncharacterized protein n=1 Tax=Arundo donax TaxID=35708 RepID=A0A0A9FFQ7_ARUDO